MNRQKGFTVIELVVTIAIVATLSISGMWSITRWQQQQQLRHGALALRQFLQLQRQHAAVTNTTLLLKVESGVSPWRIIAQSPESERPEAQFRAPEAGIALVDFTDKLGFYGERDTAWPGHITLGNASGQWRAVISAWGRVRLCRPRAEGCN